MRKLIVILMLSTLVHICIPYESAVATQQKRLAIVIGNAKYKTGSLRNPVNDARGMRSILQKLGFSVFEYENCDQQAMKRAIDEFGQNLKEYDVGLFFYAGHGVQVQGQNYLIPVDAELQYERDTEYVCVRADRVLAKMDGAGTKTNIIILDACRNNPFERSWRRTTGGQGLAYMDAPLGTFIAYATSPGQTASDGSGNFGLYTSALLENLATPDITIEEVFKRVRTTVSERSDRRQVPWESTSLTGDFYFETLRGVTVVKQFTQKTSINEMMNKGDTVIPNGNYPEGTTPFMFESKSHEIGRIESINEKYGFIVISLQSNTDVRIGDQVFADVTGKRSKLTIKRLVGEKASAVPDAELRSFSLGTKVFRQ